jgi:syntaxin 5
MPDIHSQQQFKNRTDDFRRLLEQYSPEENKNLLSKPKKAASTFQAQAQQIALQISHTAKTLRKLSNLAKKKSIFDDPTAEINELTFVVKKEIRSLQGRLEELQNIHGRRKANHSQCHNAGVVGCLDTDLEKIIKAFSQILNERSQNIQEQQKSRETFGKNTASTNTLKYSALFEEANKGEDLSLELEMDWEQSMAVQEQYNYQDGQVSEVRMIEMTLRELQTIFTKMGEMLMEHDEMIGRIDQDIDDASQNVWRGQEEIVEHWRNLSSNRWLYAKIFVVLIAFIAVWIVLFV